MSTTPLSHPTVEELTAFGLGRLGDAESVAIEGHLAECSTCRVVVASTPADSFIAKVRACRPPAETPATAEARAAGPAGETLAYVPGPAHLPPELARHPKYKVLGLLGVGGMGAVFKAEHQLMERPVALKVINPHLVSNPEMVERFRREVKAAARLTHPNIVHAYDADQAGDTHFLVMEYVEGVSLAKLVARGGPFPVADACEYVAQAARGLQHAFERGMVHRDIKPGNILLTAAA